MRHVCKERRRKEREISGHRAAAQVPVGMQGCTGIGRSLILCALMECSAWSSWSFSDSHRSLLLYSLVLASLPSPTLPPSTIPPITLFSPDTSLLSSQRMGKSTGQTSSSLAACTTSGLLSSLSSPPHPRSSVTRCTPFEWCRRGSLNSSRSH